MREDVPARERILALFDPLPAGADPVRGRPFIDAAVEFPDPRNPVHSYARERKLLMVRLVAELAAELGCREPAVLAEQLVTLADGAASRAMVLDEADYGRHARTAAEILPHRPTRSCLSRAYPPPEGLPVRCPCPTEQAVRAEGRPHDD